jgi:large subunit ribosomal protein L21
MYAIVKTGGKQYRVEKGETLLVERLAADEGSTVALEPLLIAADKPVFGADAAKAKVSAKIVGHERGPKLRVFKFKPKRGYKRRTGHRQELTRIEITEISAGATRSRAAAKPKASEAASEEASE